MSKPFGAKIVSSSAVLIRTEDTNTSLSLSPVDGAVINTKSTKILFQEVNSGSAMEINFNGDQFLFTPSNNLVATGAQIINNGSGNMAQTMSTLTNAVTLDPAAANYPELTNADVLNLSVSSRLKVNPAVAGTTIHSIIFSSMPDKDGRDLYIQNIGTNPAQTLVLPTQSGSGTTGGKFLAPGDITIAPGGGALVSYDSSVLSGSWLIRVTS